VVLTLNYVPEASATCSSVPAAVGGNQNVSGTSVSPGYSYTVLFTYLPAPLPGTPGTVSCRGQGGGNTYTGSVTW
jgi:hypothetical protein